VLQYSVSRLPMCTAATAVKSMCECCGTFKTITLYYYYRHIRDKTISSGCLVYCAILNFQHVAYSFTELEGNCVITNWGLSSGFRVHNSCTDTTDIHIFSRLLYLSKVFMDHCDTVANNNKISLHHREDSAIHVNKPNLQNLQMKKQTQIPCEITRTDNRV